MWGIISTIGFTGETLTFSAIQKHPRYCSEAEIHTAWQTKPGQEAAPELRWPKPIDFSPSEKVQCTLVPNIQAFAGCQKLCEICQSNIHNIIVSGLQGIEWSNGFAH